MKSPSALVWTPVCENSPPLSEIYYKTMGRCNSRCFSRLVRTLNSEESKQRVEREWIVLRIQAESNNLPVPQRMPIYWVNFRSEEKDWSRIAIEKSPNAISSREKVRSWAIGFLTGWAGTHSDIPSTCWVRIFKNVFFNPQIWNFLELFPSGRYRANKLMESVPIRINSAAIDSMDVGLFSKPKIIVKLLLSFENHHLEVREISNFRGFSKVFL